MTVRARPAVECGLALISLLMFGVPCAAEENRQFEFLFTIGAAGGVNPAQKFSSGLGKIIFGAPERVSPLMVPEAVTVDPEDRIWVTDSGSASVHMFNFLHNEYKVLRGGDNLAFKCPSGIDSDIHGRIYVADSCLSEIFVFDRTGEFLRFLFPRKSLRRLKRPTALVVSRDLRSIYVTDPERRKVVVLNQEGESVREWGGPNDAFTPTHLAVGDERIYVFDWGNRRVQVFSPGGSHLESLRWDQVRQPSAFGFDRENNLFFVGDPKFETVQVFNREGFAVGVFGQSGSELDQNRTPSGIYVDFRQRIYVVDPLNRKVLVFREAPNQPAR